MDPIIVYAITLAAIVSLLTWYVDSHRETPLTDSKSKKSNKSSKENSG